MTLERVDKSFCTSQSVLVSSKNATPMSSAGTPSPRTSNSHVTPVGILLVTIISAVAVVVAVFGHPTQAIAAAVIVSALAALVGGPQVLRSSAEALGLLTRFLSSTRDTVHVIDTSDQPPPIQSHDDSRPHDEAPGPRSTALT
jgi:hypothetical protein